MSDEERKAVALLCERTGQCSPRNAIVTRSTRLIEEFGAGSNPRPEALAQAQRIIQIARLDLTFDACLLPVSGGFRVELCRFHPVQRQNFSIAHEIGHTFLIELNPRLESPKREAGLGTPNGRNLVEQLCDQAAAELLWPAARFRRDAWQLGPSLYSVLELAQRYGTSVTATARRFAEFGLWKCYFILWGCKEDDLAQRVLYPQAVYKSPFLPPLSKSDLSSTPPSLCYAALAAREIIKGREAILADGERCYIESFRLGSEKEPQVITLLLIEPYAEYLAAKKRSKPQLTLFSMNSK